VTIGTITSDQLDLAVPPPEAPTYDEWVLLQKCQTAYEQARAAKRPLYPNWRRNLLLLNNRSWSDFRMSWMPSPSDSEIFPIVANLIGWLTDQSVMYTIQAAALPNTTWAKYLESLADDLEVLMQSSWKVRSKQNTVTLAWWDAAMCGAGIMKAVWDQSLDRGLGDSNLVRVDPWNFYPDPQATDETNGEYFVEVRRMSWDEIERRFPITCDKLLSELVYDLADDPLDSDSRPTNVRASPSQYPMSSTAGYPTPVTSSTGLPGQGRKSAYSPPEGIVMYEMWRRCNRQTTTPDPSWEPPPGAPDAKRPDIDVTYDDWQVVVWSSNTILLTAWASDLWDGGTHPYGRLVLEDTGEFWPTPLSTHLAPGQIAINRLLSSLQQSAELTGNPIFVEPTTAGTGQTALVNRPGQRLRENPMAAANGQGLRWLQPPSMSPDVLGLIRFWIERMENISGLSTISKGKSPAPRSPEAVVNQVQESGFVRVRSALRNCERVLRRLGGIEAQLMVENYTTARTISIVGQEGEQTAVALRDRHFLDAIENAYAPFKYSLMVNAGSEVPTSRQARIAEATNLFLIKAIDRPALLEAINFPHWQPVDARMQQMEQQMAQQQQANARQRTGRRS